MLQLMKDEVAKHAKAKKTLAKVEVTTLLFAFLFCKRHVRGFLRGPYKDVLRFFLYSINHTSCVVVTWVPF